MTDALAVSPSVGPSLTVLGCATPYPRPGAPCSGYLLRTPEAAVWIDCGSGTFAALQDHIEPQELSAIWVSHLHPDHSSDLLSAFNWAANTPQAPRLPVFGPPDWADRLTRMLPQDNAAQAVHRAFDVRELHDGHTAHVADLALHAVSVAHSVPTFGLRAEIAGAVVSYSADTGPCPALPQLAYNADVFICEAGATEPQPTHCTPAQAGQAAAQACAAQLLLTHLPYSVDARLATATATQIANCPVGAAKPGMSITWES